MAQAWGQDERDARARRPGGPPGGVSTRLGPFCLGHHQVPFSKPPTLLLGQTLHMKACEEPTSCLSVSLAMISLWSMRDSSSTSSSDRASGASGDFRALERETVCVVSTGPELHGSRGPRERGPVRGVCVAQPLP